MPEILFEKLNDTNYADWKIKMKALLVEKDLWEVTSGNEVAPSTAPNSKPMKAFLRKQGLACAKIILHIDNAQLPHVRYDDPKKIWDNLELVHRSRGFGTLLSMRRRFFTMVKQDTQSMQAWIASVRHVAFELEAADFKVHDIDLIIMLTQGLPVSYSSFIVSLDATPPDQLEVNTVITRLLNEEARQLGAAQQVTHQQESAATKSDPSSDAEGVVLYASSQRSRHGRKERRHNTDSRCYNCQGYGHVARNCPSPRMNNFAAVAKDDDDSDETIEL